MVCDPTHRATCRCSAWVLILILLEYGLRPWWKHHEAFAKCCLNPYSIGIWSATKAEPRAAQGWRVLILILLEYGLRHCTFTGEELRSDMS